MARAMATEEIRASSPAIIVVITTRERETISDDRWLDAN
jgi:hypothetical protein